MIAVDQNAFGIWVAFFDIEDAEYSASPEEFVERFGSFRDSCLEYARSRPLAAGLRVCDFGHALYFEFEDGDQSSDPLAWLRALAKELGAREFSVSAVLTHGGRWVAAAESGMLAAEREPEAGFELVRVTRPSEPLRRALYADAAAHGTDGSDGWGPGVFVDEEAIEALKRTFKNAPTALSAAGARFFRVGS
jgi:hypothetical protein